MMQRINTAKCLEYARRLFPRATSIQQCALRPAIRVGFEEVDEPGGFYVYVPYGPLADGCGAWEGDE